MATTSPSGSEAVLGGAREIEFLVSGMTCAACAARVEARIKKIAGVTAAVNFATERARVAAPGGVSALDLIAAIEEGGSTGALESLQAGCAEGAGADDARVRYLGRRLILALVFFIPLSDVSVLLSLFPSYRFPGWRWMLVALAVPVAVWAAWPFHSAPARGLRYRALALDTLVSLGIVALRGWSLSPVV